MMRGEQLERWRARNLRENQGYTLRVGDRFMDQFWQWNTVKAIPPQEGELTVENHGSIVVTDASGDEDHYAMFNWQEKFRVERSNEP